MSDKDTVFFHKNKAFLVDDNAQNLSPEAGILIAEKIEKEYDIIANIVKAFEDNRNQNYVRHSY